MSRSMKQSNLKSLLDALAFANVGNFSEFKTLLNGKDEPAPAQPAAPVRSAVVTPIRRVPSAL